MMKANSTQPKDFMNRQTKNLKRNHLKNTGIIFNEAPNVYKVNL